MQSISDSERDRLGDAVWVFASIAERPLMYLPSLDLLQFVSYLEVRSRVSKRVPRTVSMDGSGHCARRLRRDHNRDYSQRRHQYD